MIRNLLKATLGVAILPVAMVTDVVSIPNKLISKDENEHLVLFNASRRVAMNTGKNLGKIADDLFAKTEPKEEPKVEIIIKPKDKVEL